MAGDLVAFTHPSFQEFFAALLFVLCFPAEAQGQSVGPLPLAHPERRRNHLAGMALFLFGLLNGPCAPGHGAAVWVQGVPSKGTEVATVHRPAVTSQPGGLGSLLYEIREETPWVVLHNHRARLAISEVRAWVSALLPQVLPTAAGARTDRRLGRRQSDQPLTPGWLLLTVLETTPLTVGPTILLGTLSSVSWASRVTACREWIPARSLSYKQAVPV